MEQNFVTSRYDFSERVILVTGGTGALGSAVTKVFSGCNAKVISTYVNNAKIEGLEERMKLRIELIRADLGKEDQVKNLVSNVLKKYSAIHILVNVVGGYLGGKSVAELDEKGWDLMMTMNLKSAFLISKHIIPKMISSKAGKIVHVSSISGLKSAGYDSAYSASKAGLIRFVESLSEEVKQFNINVNCIMPSIIDTPQNRRTMPNADFSKWVRLQDITNLILFLCSEESKAITGSAIPIRGLA